MTRATLIINALLVLLFVWLYGGELFDASHARVAEVSALSKPPNVWLAVIALLLAALAGGVTVLGVMRKKTNDWRGYRLLPIVAVVTLFVDLLVVSAGTVPLGAFERATLALQVVEQRLNQLASDTAVPTDPATLEPLLADFGGAPWLVKGAAVPKWSLLVRANCTDASTTSAGVAAGTFIYCYAPDRSQGWLTLVGLPREQRFGDPAIVSANGEPLIGHVVPHTTTDVDDGSGTPIFEPETLQTPDASR